MSHKLSTTSESGNWHSEVDVQTVIDGVTVKAIVYRSANSRSVAIFEPAKVTETVRHQQPSGTEAIESSADNIALATSLFERYRSRFASLLASGTGISKECFHVSPQFESHMIAQNIAGVGQISLTTITRRSTS